MKRRYGLFQASWCGDAGFDGFSFALVVDILVLTRFVGTSFTDQENRGEHESGDENSEGESLDLRLKDSSTCLLDENDCPDDETG